jgi:hypothetical protein
MTLLSLWSKGGEMHNLNDSNAHPEQSLPYSTPVSDLLFKFGASGLSVMNSFLVALVGALSHHLLCPMISRLPSGFRMIFT